MSESQRHRARIFVMKSLYAQSHGNTTAINALEEMLAKETLYGNNPGFARDLVKFVEDQNEWADSQISEIADNWKLERIAAIDRIIMQMALVELKMVIDTPVKVVLNEAIELAKEFSTTESSRFINGILDRYLKDLKKSD